MDPGHLTSGTNGMLSEQKKNKECQLSVCFTFLFRWYLIQILHITFSISAILKREGFLHNLQMVNQLNLKEEIIIVSIVK